MDYATFARRALEERKEAHWPPYAHIAVWRGEATERAPVFAFLERIRAAAARRRTAVEPITSVSWPRRPCARRART
jgi:primosomal protein N'